MKYLVTRIAWLTLLLGSLVGWVQAQDTNTPIYFLKDHDIWRWTTTSNLQPLTNDRYIVYGDISPDGTRLAVLVYSPITVDLLEQSGGMGGGPLPTDIALVDLATGAVTPIATQPPDATMDSSSDTKAIVRSEPTWSPDGTRIAWSENHYASGAEALPRVMIYDVAAQTTEVAAANLPRLQGIGSELLSVSWSGDWLVTDTVVLDATSPTDFPFLVYPNHIRPNWEIVTGYVVVEDIGGSSTGGPLVATLFSDGRWQFANPLTGDTVDGLNPPELRNPTVADSLTLTFTTDPDLGWCANHIWTVNATATLDFHGCDGVVISPDGQSLAYVAQDDTLTIWKNGVQQANLATVGIVQDIFWGAANWRSGAIPPRDAEPIPPPIDPACGSVLPPRLHVSGWAQVIPNTTPNNVRLEPDLESAIVGQVEPGKRFWVIDGPQCADGLLWWFVDTIEQSGWTAEGGNLEYWVEPLD